MNKTAFEIANAIGVENKENVREELFKLIASDKQFTMDIVKEYIDLIAPRIEELLYNVHYVSNPSEFRENMENESKK